MQRLHPNLRLGWCGDAFYDEFLDEDYPEGHYVVVQLYHRRDAEGSFFAEYPSQWPLHGKPYDPLIMRPMYKFRVSPREVWGGAVLEEIKRFLRPIREEFLDYAAEHNSEEDTKWDDMIEEFGDRLYHSKGEGAPILADKFLTQEEKDVLAGDVEDLTKDITEERFSPPEDVEGVKMR